MWLSFEDAQGNEVAKYDPRGYKNNEDFKEFQIESTEQLIGFYGKKCQGLNYFRNFGFIVRCKNSI